MVKTVQYNPYQGREADRPGPKAHPQARCDCAEVSAPLQDETAYLRPVLRARGCLEGSTEEMKRTKGMSPFTRRLVPDSGRSTGYRRFTGSEGEEITDGLLL